MTGLMCGPLAGAGVVALMVFATNFPRAGTGSAARSCAGTGCLDGRGLCLVKKERHSGRVPRFRTPHSCASSPGSSCRPLIALGYHYVKTREWDRRYLRMIMGGAVAVAVLVPVSFAVTGRPSIYPEFLRNTAKALRDTADQPHGAANGDRLPSGRGGQPYEHAGHGGSLAALEGRSRAAFHESLPLYLSLVACFLVLMGLAIRNVEPWVTVALSATVISFGSELDLLLLRLSHNSRLLYAGGSAGRRVDACGSRP